MIKKIYFKNSFFLQCLSQLSSQNIYCLNLCDNFISCNRIKSTEFKIFQFVIKQ